MESTFEWTNSKIAFVLLIWIWGLIGAGFFVYGLYHLSKTETSENFRYVGIEYGQC
jgi:hypothetical protein